MTTPQRTDLTDQADPTEPVPTDQLPAAVRAYLAAREAGDLDAALRVFTPGALVVDEGRSFRGTDQVRDFLHRAGAGFTYTTELVGAQRLDTTTWVALQRLEGDFPGGVADLSFRFVLVDDLVGELVIAP